MNAKLAHLKMMKDLGKYLLHNSTEIKARTSSIQLNLALNGGLYSNQFYHFWGPPNSYKSAIALSVARNTNDFVILLNFVRQNITYKYKNLIIINPRSAKQGFEVLRDMPELPVSCIVVDSLPSIYIRDIYGNKAVESITTELIKYLHKFHNPAVIYINQLRTNYSLGFSTSYYGNNSIIKVVNSSIYFMKGLEMPKYDIINFKIDYSIDGSKGMDKIMVWKHDKEVSSGYSVYLYELQNNRNLTWDQMLTYDQQNTFEAYLKQNQVYP